MPFLIYLAVAAGFGWSIHKKKWGWTALSGAVLIWLLVMQIVIAIISLFPKSSIF